MPNNLLTEGVGFVGGLGVADAGTVTGSSGAATLNRLAGIITTESLTTAAGATFTETLANAQVAATDIILASVTTSGNGTPVISKITPTAGQIVFVVQNIHASAAFNAAIKIAYVVVKQS